MRARGFASSEISCGPTIIEPLPGQTGFSRDISLRSVNYRRANNFAITAGVTLLRDPSIRVIPGRTDENAREGEGVGREGTLTVLGPLSRSSIPVGRSYFVYRAAP